MNVITYLYDPITKEYLGTSTADENNIPDNNTIIQPPQINSLEVAVFEETNWIIRSDYRDQAYFYKDTKKRVIFEIGQLPDDTMTILTPSQYDVWDYEHGYWREIIPKVLAEFEYSYTDLIALKNSKNILNAELNYKSLCEEDETLDEYKIWFIDQNQEFYSLIDTENNPSDCANFVDTYKDNANSSVGRDKHSGQLIVKPRPVEARFYMNCVYFKTGLDVLDQGVNSDWSINIETEGITTLTYQPSFSFYLEGGDVNAIFSSFVKPVKVKMVIAPAIPAEYGGSHYFVEQKKFLPINIPFCYSLEVITPPAYIKYYAGMPQLNELNIIFEHNVTDNAEFELSLRTYK